MKRKQSVKEWAQDIAVMFAGSVLYAVSVNWFTAPADIAPGGVTGIATMLHHVFDWIPIGTAIFVINIPLFLLAFKFLGRESLLKTVIATVMTSVIIDLSANLITFNIIPAYTGDHLLAAIYGGVISGLGLALIFLRGGTTGGTDISAKLLRLIFHHVSIGKLILAVDSVVIITSALVYNSVESALYACIVIYASTAIIDHLLYNSGMGKVLYIISDSPGLVSDAILHKINRGVTVLHGQGGFSKEDKQIIFCVVRRSEVWRVRQLVRDVDPRAFVIVSDAGQVLGEGFSTLDSNED